MSNNNDFALFIDELRESRNLSKEEFVEGIMSTRQYHRFIKGESSIKSAAVQNLLDKLEVNSIASYETFLRKRNESYDTLSCIYELIYNDNYPEAVKKFADVNYSNIKTDYNKKYYMFLKMVLDIHTKKTPKEAGINYIKQLIDYPNILNKNVLSFIEISSLMYISDYVVKGGDNRIPEYTYNQLKEDKNSDFLNVRYPSFPFYLTTAKCLGRIGETKKSLEVAEKGIALYHTHNSLSYLISMNYVKALNERKLYSSNLYKRTLTEIFALLYVHKNQKFVNEVKSIVEKNFGYEESDLLEFKN